MAKVVCPACKQMNSFPAIEAGAELMCQHCSQAFRVRAPGAAPPASMAKPAQPAAVSPKLTPARSPLTPLPPLSPLTPISPLNQAPEQDAPVFAELASPNPFALPQPFGQPTPFPPQAAPSPLTPIHSQPAASPFAAVGSNPPKPGWNPPSAGPPQGSNNLPVLIGVLGLLGVGALFCGGLGVMFYMKVKSQVVAATDRVKAENERRQQELQREMNNPLNQRMNQKPVAVPQPPPAARKKTSSNTSKQSTSQPRVAAPTPRKMRPAPTSDTERLTQILADLKDPRPERPLSFTLDDLERMPVQESRRAEVSQALEPLLQSTDTGTARAAARAVGVWGTEANVSTLCTLITSSDLGISSEAIRALPKLSKTEATAELLAARLENFGPIGALRDAFKELGPVGEHVLLKRLASSDRRLRTNTHMVLVDVGGQATRDALEDLIQKETDTGLRMMAENTLRRMKSRSP